MFLALSRFRRRKFDTCVETCSDLLEKNQYDQSVWYLKARALTMQSYIDDTEVEEEVSHFERPHCRHAFVEYGLRSQVFTAHPATPRALACHARTPTPCCGFRSL